MSQTDTRPGNRTPALFAARALLPRGWADDVTLQFDEAGVIAAVAVGAPPPPGAERAGGPVVPALPNLHSHAFQRAMAGLAEVASGGADSFWSWREAMYRLVGRLDPDDVEAIARALFVELLKGGFGSVAEFHYLHHGPGGTPYADPAEMALRVARAADDTGIGLSLLPVFYAHAGFGGAPPTAGQARFVHDTDGFARLRERLAAEPGFRLGTAIHSLRAATPAEIRAVLREAPDGPVHIHAAEQPREVEACVASLGARPVRWLLDVGGADARWCLVHATHMDEREVGDLARSGAVAGLCPATEANLGDGVFPASAYLAAGGAFGVGTDSHVATGVAEELRTLEYGQRLRHLGRNVVAAGPGASVGRTLLEAALAGGDQALGRRPGGLAPGRRADLVVLDGREPLIAAAEGDAVLDRWLFALGGRPVVRDVMVAGAWRVREGRHPLDEAVAERLGAVLRRLAA